MSIKSLLFVYGGHDHEAGALESTLDLARALRATVRIVHIAEPPVPPYVLGISEYAMAPIGDGSVVDLLERDARELAAAALMRAQHAARHKMVPWREGMADMVSGQAQAFARSCVGAVSACLPQEAHSADLVVTCHEGHPAGDLKVAVTTLFEAGRPLLLLPRDLAHPLPASGHPGTVVLAWDGSRSAARALREAVPLMLHAQDVTLLRILGPGTEPDIVSEDDVLIYLRSHCISARFIHVERGARSVGAAIVEHAAALRAELLVMGAYGHGHVREMLLGGATDHVIKTADLPLLLVH